jgi:DNA-binding MarR family transcriptional regulator
MKKTPADDIDVIAEQWQNLGLETDFVAWQSIGRILRISKLLESKIGALHASYELKIGEFDVLSALKRANGVALTPSQLYQSMLLSSGAMTSRLDRLESRQLISREHCPQDRRSVKVSLTPQGKKLINAVYPVHFALLKDLLSPMSASDKRQLAALLKTGLAHIAAAEDESA